MSGAWPLTIVFAGGGTGGHLLPALAIAEEVVARSPRTRVRFLCSERPLDTAILKEQQLAGRPVEFMALGAKPFGVRPRALVRFATTWGGAVRQARRVIQEARAAGDVKVVSGGGFVAA